MLTESEIIAAVCRYLRRNGWTVVSICNELQRGDDIVAEHRGSGRTVVVEAKGETSSKASSRRHGQPFNSAQVSSHVSRAFYRAAQSVGSNRLSAMALPRTAPHIDRVRRIDLALRQLNLEVFWVDPQRRVTREGIWQGNSKWIRNMGGVGSAKIPRHALTSVRA